MYNSASTHTHTRRREEREYERSAMFWFCENWKVVNIFLARTCTPQRKIHTHTLNICGDTSRRWDRRREIEKHTRIIHNIIIIILLEKAINRTSWCLCNSCSFFSMVKHENYATRDQLYSLFFFFNYFEFNSIWVCVCVRGPFTHWNRNLEWKFWEREKYELNKNTQNRTILFVDCGIVFCSRANAITKRNLWHALNGEIVWMTWAVNKRAHLNRIEFVLACVCLGVITLGIMLCECTHWSYGVYYMILVIYEEKKTFAITFSNGC